MTDRELLELAAKAAGLNVHWGEHWQSDMLFRELPRPNSPLVANIEWNPLTDDGDALRLAVKLDLVVCIGCASTPGGDECESGMLRIKQDPLAATRRAIVRAAAEIGRAMP